MISHACNSRTLESEAQGWPQIQGQTELWSKNPVLEFKELENQTKYRGKGLRTSSIVLFLENPAKVTSLLCRPNPTPLQQQRVAFCSFSKSPLILPHTWLHCLSIHFSLSVSTLFLCPEALWEAACAPSTQGRNSGNVVAVVMKSEILEFV